MRAQVRLLPGRRLHLQDGPIDLVLDARGEPGAVGDAYRAAAMRFATVLDELCAELPLLRTPADPTRCRGPLLPSRLALAHISTAGEQGAVILPRKGKVARPKAETDGDQRREAPLPASCAPGDPTRHPSGATLPVPGRGHPTLSPPFKAAAEMCADASTSKGEGRDSQGPTKAKRTCNGGGSRFAGVVARRMEAAVLPFAAETFITPMAAVAGAVAEEILDAMTSAAKLRRASVNDGGDIALHLGSGESVRIGMVDRPDRPGLFGHVELAETSPVRGVATSGCRGRSFSLGIADAVTVLARTAAEADAAATVVANAVDLPGHPAITRVPAAALQPDSDLGGRLVTRVVGALAPHEIDRALAAGQRCARDLVRRDLIIGAALHLQGVTRTVGGDGLRVTLRPRAVEPLRLRA